MKLLTTVIPAAGGPGKAWLDEEKAFDTGGVTAPNNFTAPVDVAPRTPLRSRARSRTGRLVVTGTKPFGRRTCGTGRRWRDCGVSDY
nr:hypothetical protein GCM10010200_021300 [Actinomadura rugatobispora]